MHFQPLSIRELEELRHHGFVIRRGAFADIAGDVMNVTGEKIEAILSSGIDFKRLMQEAGAADPVMRETGSNALITVSDHFACPLLAGWTMDFSGNTVHDIRLDRAEYHRESGNALAELAKRVHAVLSPFGGDLSSNIQVRWIPPSDGEQLANNELRKILGFHSDGTGLFRKRSNLKHLPAFRFLVGAYLTDLDREYFEHPCGQLVVLDGGHRLVSKLYAETIPLLNGAASAKARTELFNQHIAGAVHGYCVAHPEELVTVRAKPGDLMIAHCLIPHASNEAYFTDPSNRPAGRTAIYIRAGDFSPDERGGEALTNPELAWALS